MIHEYSFPDSSRSEVAYMITVPNTPHTCGDVLDPKLVDELTRKKVTPINPHAQRLLTAQARSAKATPKPPGKAQKPQPKNAKGGKRKSLSHEDRCDDEHADDEGEPMKRPAKKSKDMGNEPAPCRTEYMEAKKKFFQGNLYCKKSSNVSEQIHSIIYLKLYHPHV